MIQDLINELRLCQQWMDENNIGHTTSTIYKADKGQHCVCAVGAMYARKYGIERLANMARKNDVYDIVLSEFPAVREQVKVLGLINEHTGLPKPTQALDAIWNFNDGHYGDTNKALTPGEIADLFEAGYIYK